MNRVELSANSKLGGNSLADIDDLLSNASKMNLDGIAITDYNDINSFFEIESIRSNYPNLDIIYGTKIKVKYGDLLIKIDILVKNEQGLRNLYKIMTLANRKLLDIDVYNLFENSNGMLVGLNVMNDNIYNKLKNLNSEDVFEFIKIFDYLIVTPSNDHDYIIKMVNVSKYYHKLLVSSSLVRYISREDKKIYEIFKGHEVFGNNYLMSTNEMLEEFSYLSENDRKKIVIDDCHKIISLIDKNISLIPNPLYFKEENYKNKLIEEVFKRANTFYQNKIPLIVKKRIDDELALINEINSYNILINSNLVRISEEKGYITYTRGNVSSSFINYLLNISKINPLEYDLDYREFFKDGNSILRISINYDWRVKDYLLDYLNKEFGNLNVIRCGGSLYTSENFIKEKINTYERIHNIRLTIKKKEKIISKLTGIKRQTGMLSGAYLCFPKYQNACQFSPLISLGENATMSCYHHIEKNILIINMLETSYNLIYDDMLKLIKIKNICLSDFKVWDYLCTNDMLGIIKEQKLLDELKNSKPTNINKLANVYINVYKTKDWIPSRAHALEYSLIIYKLYYMSYYFDKIFSKVIKRYR